MEEKSKRSNASSMKRMLDALIPIESRPENVGPRIAAARKALGLSKSELADALTLDRSSLTKIENGSMGFAIANAIKFETLYGIGIRFTYRHDFSDLPDDLREPVRQHLATLLAAK
ncbi:helix-turn-helix domain-containing protein [Roseicyclus sp.]|uniref:helix-turn-helix domain-containing protein n=1 Tax=Roseicyclus sp. TaxID=1914329 RepID=UPI003F6B9825